MIHPAGARHWTRRKPELIKRGAQSHAAKLSADDIERLYRFADAGWQPSETRIATLVSHALPCRCK
jgi:hypothetical protein